MFVHRSFFIFVTLLYLVPAAVFAMNRDEEGKQPKTMVACASSHPQFETQLENTPATPLEITAQQIFPLLQLPPEIVQRILLFACEDDARPERLEKDWARLRLVCTTFNRLIMGCPQIWAQTNVLLDTIKDTSGFLTLCPLKNLLHVTVNTKETKLLDASNQATFDELKVAMAENPSHFTLSAPNPTEEQLQTLVAQPSPLHIEFGNTYDVPLSLLTNVPNLQRLKLEWCRDVQTLHLNCPPLKTLSIIACTALSKLSLSSLPNLKVLKIDGAALKTLSLEHLEKLHTLDVFGFANREALPLDKLPNPGALEVLRIRTYGCFHDAQTIPFHLLHNLHTLMLEGEFDLNPDFLTLLPKLEHLELYRCTNTHTLHFKHKRLKTLIIGECATLPPLSSENLPRLRVLKLNECSGLTHLPLANMHNLKILRVVSCDGLENIVLEGFFNLEAVTFQKNFALNNLSIDQLPVLQTLEILTCTHLNELNLGTLPKLQSVSVEEADSLQTAALNQLPCLEVIMFKHCNAFTNLSLTQLPALQNLELKYCRGPTHLALKQLPGFQTLSCWQCDSLSVLSLEEVPNFQKLQLFYCPQLVRLSVHETPKLEAVMLYECYALKTLAIPDPLPHLNKVLYVRCGTALAEQIAALEAQAQANGGQVERL